MALTESMILQKLQQVADIPTDAGIDFTLFSSGMLDSVAMLNLIMFVEEVTGMEIRADEVTLENFDSPARIMQFAMARAA